MTCDECLSIIEEYVEDSLDPQISDRAAAHVSACESCRTIYDELKTEQAMYARYLLKIKEKPDSWDAVRSEIRKGKDTVQIGAETVGAAGLYQKLLAVFYPRTRRYSWTSALALIIVIGIGFGFWYRNHVKRDDSISNIVPSSIRENEVASGAEDSVNTSPTNLASNDSKVISTHEESQSLKGNKSLISRNKLTAFPSPAAFSLQGKKTKTKPENNDAAGNVGSKVKESPVSFDSSEAAFAEYIEKSEMVLRSFRNAVQETDGSGLDISYEKRLSKQLLSNSIEFRREAKTQGNIPAEKLLARLEPIFRDIAALPERVALSEAKAIKGRIQQSGIIITLQIESASVRTSD